jgi:carboxy-terminal domain RNA polymerase II polypeptide A small phosphatase
MCDSQDQRAAELSDYFKSLRLDRDVHEVGSSTLPRDGSSSITDECFRRITTQALHHEQPGQHHTSVPPLPERKSDLGSGDGGLKLLPPLRTEHRSKNTLVLDLDETLVHSSASRSSHNPNSTHDVKLPLILGDGQRCEVFVKLRPFVNDFLHSVGRMFEVVVFTASLSKYASPLISVLDPDGKNCHHRLFREHCTEYSGSFVKDLTLLGRSLNRVIIIDNSPAAYLYQPRNAIPCTTWVGDPSDNELPQFLPLLQLLSVADDVYPILDAYHDLLRQNQTIE